jgi:CRP-like cAMP-binding protein
VAEEPNDLDRQLSSAGRAVRRAESVLAARRAALYGLMLRAQRLNRTKSHIARMTGYTREHVTEILKGLEKNEDKRREAETAAAQFGGD